MSESVFDPQLFADNIDDTYSGNVVGYASSINAGGQIAVAEAFGGRARTPVESGPAVDFDTDTLMTSASVAKTITATAILKLIQTTPGLDIGDSITPYLPTNWTIGANINSITFEELLTHRSGIRVSGSLGNQTFYSGLQNTIDAGINLSDKADFSYQNANFALMRVMLGYIWDAVPNNQIESGIALLMPTEVRSQVLADWSTFVVSQDAMTASIYKAYVKTQVFEPMGIFGAETQPTGPSNQQTQNYVFPDNGQNGDSWGSRLLFAGGEGWYLSAEDYATFLHHLFEEDTVLNSTSRSLMQNRFLGLMDPGNNYGFSEGMFGTYYTHGGDLWQNSSPGVLSSDLNTGIAAFPNGVQASILINSSTAPGISYQVSELKEAYENAWTELAFAGTNGDDVITVDQNADGSQILISREGDDEVITLRTSSIERLRLHGRRGDDTFNIVRAPNIDLEIIAGRGSDTLNVSTGDWDSDVRAQISFNGGLGTDHIDVDDSSDDFGNDIYEILNNSVYKTGSIGRVVHSSTESMRLDANQQPNIVRLIDPIVGTSLVVDAGGGDDQIVIQDSTLFSSVSISGGNGEDTLTLQDSIIRAPVGMNGGRGADTITAVNSTVRSTLTLTGWTQADDIDVDNVNLTSVGRIRVNADSGTDNVRLSQVTGPTGSSISLFGGTSKDIMVVDGASGGIGILMQGDEGNDSLRVLNSSLTETVVASGSSGNDFIRLGGGDISSNLNGQFAAFGGEGNDHLVLEDREGAGSNDFYVFNEGILSSNSSLIRQNFTKSGFAGLIWHDETEEVTLKGTQQDSTTNIRTLHTDTTLNVNVVGGDDEVRIHTSQLRSTINVNAGAGNDEVRIAPESNQLTTVAGDVSVDGESGSFDRLYLSDQNSTGTRSYGIRETDFTRANEPGWTYRNFSEVRLQADDTRNVLNVESLLPDVHLIAFLNGGDDTARLASRSRDLDSSIQGDVTIWGGEDRDRLFLSDQRDTGNDTYDLTPTTFRKSGTDTWTLTQFEATTLYANLASNTINVSRFGSQFSDPTLRIFGGNGNDHLIVGAGVHRTTFIYDDITFYGQAGADRLTIDDTANASNRTYTMTNSEVDLGGLFGRVRHILVETVVVDGGTRNDLFHVESNLPTVQLELNGNNGSDSFRIAEPSKNLDSTEGDIRISGGSNGAAASDDDQVFIYDRHHPDDDDYSIVRSSAGTATISRMAESSIRVGSVDTTNFYAGRGDNVIDVDGFNPGSELIVNAGLGNDRFNVLPTPALPFLPPGVMRLNGGGGDKDFLNVLDVDSINLGPYAVTYREVYRQNNTSMPITYANMDRVSLSVDQGANEVFVESTRPGTAVTINTGRGDDRVKVTSPSSRVTVNGGANGSGGDRVEVEGTEARESFTIQGESIRLEDGEILTQNIETRLIDGVAGNDIVSLLGVAGVQEAFAIQPNLLLPNVAELTTAAFSNIFLVDVPRMRVFGNTNDDDSLVFHGTSGIDQFDIDLSAIGTAADPVVAYSNTSGSNLQLQSYGRAGTLNVHSESGADILDVRVSNQGPAAGRDLLIDGGSPTNSLRTMDRLNVRYPSSATVTHDIDDLDSGSIDLAFAQRDFLIEYDDIEDIQLDSF